MTLTTTHTTITGSKYVPPHLRNQSGGPSNAAPRGGGFGGSQRGSYNSDRRDSRGGGFSSDRAGGGFGSDRRPSYGGGGERPSFQSDGPPKTNTRWSNVDAGGSGDGGYAGRRDSGYRRDDARVNERGFHGDMKPDKRLERQLFDRSDKQTTGINFDNYDQIPVETSGTDVPDPIESYSVDSIGEDLYRNTQLCGYTKPTPVQKYSVPIGIAGRDLMACAQTGSGKTAGFLFPIIMSMIKTGGQQPPEGARRRVYPEALVLAPTRELASQIQDEASKFTYCAGIASVVVYGGAEVREQLRQIERGCDLLVATPGRLVDLIERGRLAMDNVRFLVLDEADRMLDVSSIV